MAKIKTSALIITLLFLGINAYGNNPAPKEILNKVEKKYKTMNTFKSEGLLTASTEDEMGEKISYSDISFSILLKKPNMYLITWTPKKLNHGKVWSITIWNDGIQPYLYFGDSNLFFKMANDENAFHNAKKRYGFFNIIPSIFLQVLKKDKDSFIWMENPNLEKIEKIGEEDCYVISGTSAFSKKEILWVSKSSFLIKKYYRAIDNIKSLKQRTGITNEERKILEEIYNNTLSTHSYTEVYSEMSFPELNQDDFNFSLPEGTVPQDSWLGD
jgi:hypothetical protein